MDGFFVKPNDTLFDKVSDAYGLTKRNPAFGDRFDAIKELRTIDHGQVHKGNAFRRVASLIAPLEDLAKILDPEFLKDKAKFYRWLDKHPEYCTYQRSRFRSPNMIETGGIVAPGKPGGV